MAKATKAARDESVDPVYAPIETEWKKVKKERKGKTPYWYNLFGGPSSIELLAKRMRLGTLYEFLYRDWSTLVHAQGGFANVAKSGEPGKILIKPIRHPEGIETVCSFAGTLHLCVMQETLKKFLPEGEHRHFLLKTGIAEWSKLQKKVQAGGLINVPWK